MEIPTIIAPAVCITRCIQQIGRTGESTFDLTSMWRLVAMVLMAMTMETMSIIMRRMEPWERSSKWIWEIGRMDAAATSMRGSRFPAHPHHRCSHWVEAVPAGVGVCWLRVLSTVLRSACRERTEKEDELYHWLSKQVVKEHPKKILMWRSVKNSKKWCPSVVPTFTSELGMLHSTRIDNSSSSTWKRQSVYASQIPPRGSYNMNTPHARSAVHSQSLTFSKRWYKPVTLIPYCKTIEQWREWSRLCHNTSIMQINLR